MTQKTYDVLIIGGGPAGLTAALYLGRSRKSVLVVDRGNPRHAVSQGVHNFLTRDGMAPAALREVAWKQMATYPSVGHLEASVSSLTREGERWVARMADGQQLLARAVLLATGMVDEHPDIPGYRERWAHAIHHCPFCHGWESRERPLAVLGHGEALGHMAPLLLGWSDDVVVLSHGRDIPADTRQHLKAKGIAVYDATVKALRGPGRNLEEIVLKDGTKLARKALFVMTPQHQVQLVQDLGLKLDADGYVETDAFGATSLPMMWAAGDLTSRMQQVVLAAAQGAKTGVTMTMALTL